jgi:hypothetical protein
MFSALSRHRWQRLEGSSGLGGRLLQPPVMTNECGSPATCAPDAPAGLDAWRKSVRIQRLQAAIELCDGFESTLS